MRFQTNSFPLYQVVLVFFYILLRFVLQYIINVLYNSLDIMILKKSTFYLFSLFIALFSVLDICAQDTLGLDIQSKTGTKGGTVCLNITARNFKNIESIQFNLSYNATLVSPQCPATNVHPGLKNNIFGELFNCNSKDNGYINFVWASDPTTIPDGDVLFTLCFDIKGDPGNTSPVSINGNILLMEVCREISGKTVCLNKVNTSPASIDIKTNTLSIFINKCDADIINTTDKGSLTFYATGGLAPYSYNINSGEFTGSGLADGQRITLNNLPQKAYIIVITDASGLPVSSSKTISNNIPFTYDKLPKDPLCADRNNGSIKIYNVRGGIGPFVYEWSNLVSAVTQDSFVLKDLYVGKYSVTVTDFNGCKKTDSFELVRAPLLLDVKFLSNAACSQSGVFGSIEISASGGTPFITGDPYTLTINSGINFRINPPYLYSPRAGNFTLRISDGNGCSTDIRPFVMPADYAIDMTAAVKDVSCKNAKDGSVSLTVSPYSKNNSFFPLFGYPDIGGLGVKNDTLILTGISPGSYAYRMIDFNNCRDTVFFTVKEPDSLKINSTLVHPECDKPGSITLNASGGNAAYNYTWNPPQTGNTNTLSNLTGGTFKVTVSDANNCKDSLSVTLNQQGILNVNPEIVKAISCNGANDGILRVDIQSGNGPFDVKWTDSLGVVVSIGQTILNVKPGTYTVQVTDKSMCSSFPMTVTISEPAPFFMVLGKTDALCNNENGQTLVNVTGGNSGYTFEWQKSGNATVIGRDTILDAKAGLYIVSAINTDGCRIKDSISIIEPDSILLNQIVVQTNCDLLGSIALNPSGGTPDYRYRWSVASAGDTSLIKDLSGGQYSVTVTDSNNCTTSFTQNINQQGKPEITTETQNISCFSAKNGSLKVNIQSPNGPFGVVWKDSAGTTVSSQPTVQNIGPGNYTVQVTDKNNCSSEIKQVVITEPESLALIKNISNAICFQDQGSILVDVTGGSGSYKYEWQKAGNALVIDNDSLLISSAGKYVFKITDGNNCIKTDTITIDEPLKISSPTPNIRNITCFGLSDGLAAIFNSPAGINFKWSTGSIGPFSVNLPAGNAWVIANNSNNCVSDTTFFEIKSPSRLTLDTINTITSNPSCFGLADGSISIAAAGGTGSNYRYSWQNGPNGSFISGLGVGNYIVTIRDSLDCTAIDSVTLTQPSLLTASRDITNTIIPDCNNINGGKIAVLISGGNAGLKTVSWQSGVNVNNGAATGLKAGKYCATISDALGCSTTFCDSLIQNLNQVNTTTKIDKSISCNGLKDGEISVTATGNGVPLTINWLNTNGAVIGSNAVVQNLGSGKYYVLVSEQNGPGCRNLDSITIQEPAKINFPAPQTRNVTCFGLATGQGTIVGGGPELTYTWSSGAKGMFATDLIAGQNWVFANNANNCKSDTTFFNVGTFAPISLDTAKTLLLNPSCFGSTNGTINITAKGGTGISYVYAWANGFTGNSLANVGAGKYIVTINDSNNCQHTDSVSLSQPAKLHAAIDNNKSVALDCKNLDGGKIGIITTGGNPGIKKITWQSGLTVENDVAIGLKAGNYCATVSDNFGCKDTFCYDLISSPGLRGQINNPAPPLCNGGTTCISIKSLSGGTGSKYTFQINNGKRYPIDTCVTVTAGQYFVSMIDSSGCSIDTLITIPQPAPISVDLGNDIEIQLGQDAALLKVDINSPSSIDSIIWTPKKGINCLSPSCTTLEANPSETTTYLVSVTDNNGCKGSDEITITVKNVRNVFFPNIFSPNRDGVNDYFQAVIGPGVEQIISFYIFDRWGNLVFEKSSFVPDPAGSDGWDGTYNGKKLDPGVFVYYAKARFIDGKEIQYSGSVTLADKVRN